MTHRKKPRRRKETAQERFIRLGSKPFPREFAPNIDVAVRAIRILEGSTFEFARRKPVVFSEADIRFPCSLKPSSGMAGFLSVERRGGVLHTRLRIGFDFGRPAKGVETIRIDDHLLEDEALRTELRELLLGEVKPFVERLGKVVRVAHHAPDALVILATVPTDGASDDRHEPAPAGRT